MNIQVDTSSPVPPYEQLRAQIRALVASGALAEGARLPSIRQLAGDLDLAVNTVGRAYRELELQGVIRARGRHGTVVVGVPALGARERRQTVEQAAQVYVNEVGQHGVSEDDAVEAVRRAFRTAGNERGAK